MFHTLSKKYLDEFLPKDIQIPKITFENLNVKLPLQESGYDWYEIRNILLESPDPLYRDYYIYRAQKYHYNSPELVEHRERGLEICKKLDKFTIPISTPSQPTFPSPPSTFKQAEKRSQLQAAKQMPPSTPSLVKLNAATKLSTDDVSLDSGPAYVEVSTMDKSEQKKRKRVSLVEETPRNLVGSRPAKTIYIDSDELTDSEELTKHPVNRILDFKSVAEPKEIIAGAIHDVFSDLNDLPDGDWGLD
jgi:hypothetical protein